MFQLSYWKTLPILAMVLLGILFSLPNIYPESFRQSLPGFIPSSKLVLGLDLQGGSHIVLEIEKTKFKQDLLKQLVGDIRQKLRENKIRYTGLRRIGSDAVTVTIKNPEDMDKILPKLKRLRMDTSGGLLNMGIGAGASTEIYKVTVDGQKVSYHFTEAGLNNKIGQAIGASLKIITLRINSLGTTEPVIQRQGIDRILVQVPGLKDPDRLKKLLGKTAKLTFQLVCDSQPTGENQRPPLDCEELAQKNVPGVPLWVKTSRRDSVDGANLVDSQPGFDSRNGEPIVTFRFNTKGGLDFGRLTRDNVGRPFAIVLDREVVSAPVIQTPILGGSGQISGRFTVQEANDLAIVLRSGALPAELTIVEQRTVGASLGADSVKHGFEAAVLGLILVVIFMFVTYGLFGIFANLALFANLAMLIGVLSGLGATLTLPGIAGIVLTMGMAVDSNVLVFERIREEVRAGRSPLNSIDTGFQRALGTVLDANITTLIAAVVLFALGSGPVKGFAVTLGVGIVTTVFTAFTFTRLIVALWVIRYRPKTVPM